MATAGEERRRSLSAGHIFMGLVAVALGLTAAYLWLTDGNPSRPFHLQSPAPPAAVAAIMPAKDPAVVVSRPTPAAPKPVPQAAPQPAVASAPETAPADQTGAVDPQVAADAAAVGMTVRVRPSDPGSPGQ